MISWNICSGVDGDFVLSMILMAKSLFVVLQVPRATWAKEPEPSFFPKMNTGYLLVTVIDTGHLM